MLKTTIKSKAILTLGLFAGVAALLAASYIYLEPDAPAVNGTRHLESYVLALRVAQLVLWLVLALVVVRVVGFAMFETLRRSLTVNVPPLLQNVFTLSIYTLIFFFAFRHFFPNVELGAVFTTSAVFGVIIGLALQDTLGNFFSGLSLHADRPFAIGDCITVNKWTGIVESITWRAVKLRTFTNHLVFINNANIAKEAIEVCPRHNLNARLVLFGAQYRDSPARVIEAVREAVRDAPNVSRKIKPLVRVRAFGDSSVDYEVKYWLEDYAQFNDTDAALRQRIWYAFARANLHFAFPTRTLHVESIEAPLTVHNSRHSESATTDSAMAAATPSGVYHASDFNASAPYALNTLHERRAKLRVRKTQARIAQRLARLPLFAALTEEERAHLAAASARHAYAKDEIIIRAGETAASMFVIHRGAAEVQLKTPTQPKIVALKEGDVFGEMALLTGEARTADVVAASHEVEVIEISNTALKPLLDANQTLVDSLSEIVAARQIAHLTNNAEIAPATAQHRATIAARIRRFFNLT